MDLSTMSEDIDSGHEEQQMVHQLEKKEAKYSKRGFPFFELPRELRDRIYGCCLCTLSHHYPSGTLTLEKTCFPQLRTISCGFKCEYEEEAFRHTTAKMQLVSGESYGIDMAPAYVLCNIRHLDLVLRDHRTLSEFWAKPIKDIHGELVAMVDTLLSLRELHITTSIDGWDFDRANCHLLAFLETAAIKSGSGSGVSRPPLRLQETLLLTGKLFTLRSCRQSGPQHAYYRALHSWMEKKGYANSITYKATPAKHEGAWNGFDLETHSVGFDVSVAIKAFESQYGGRTVSWFW